MLPANRDDRTVYVQRIVDADQDALNDALTDFAVEHGLEVDRSHEGDGVLFRAARDAPENAMFRGKDTLLVTFAPAGSAVDVCLAADMAGLEERGDAWKRGRLVRGSLFAAILVAAGVGGMAHVSIGDFIPIGLGGLVMSRTLQRVRGEADSREALQRDVANALHRVLDDAEMG
ncbi:MAG TPA: hypothetical protein VHC63_17785 [Acidimicrobiales bacterium]|nr:hypothetical protein [Acidimicrobiales bacterium]